MQTVNSFFLIQDETGWFDEEAFKKEKPDKMNIDDLYVDEDFAQEIFPCLKEVTGFSN